MTETRDWDATWEHWRDLTPEERAVARAELHARIVAANHAYTAAMEYAAKAMRAFGEAFNRDWREAVPEAIGSEIGSVEG